MRILIYGINFAPELTGTGKYTGEMAAWLAARGHEVTAIAAPPYYPQYCVHEGHRASRYAAQWWQGVRVLRAPLWVPARPGGAKRLLHLATFALSSLPLLLHAASRRPDVIIAVEPPLFCAPAAAVVARLCGARSWLHIQDYEVDAAFELGLLKGGALRQLASGLERWLMRHFDRVSTISERMLDRARDKGVDPARLVFFPNWIDVSAARAAARKVDYRAQLGIPRNAVVAMYAGNMGGKQGLDTLADVALLLRHVPGLHFVFCGEGPQRSAFQAQCAGLAQTHFLPLQPVEHLPALLAAADIHMLPQRAGAADLVMPSKLTGMLASGRPVVCGAASGTELANVVRGCGRVVMPDNAFAMARAVLRLARQPERRAALGAAARHYAQSAMHSEWVLGRFERDLSQLCPPRLTVAGTP